MLKRFFSFALVAGAMVSSAQGALLLKYNMNARDPNDASANPYLNVASNDVDLVAGQASQSILSQQVPPTSATNANPLSGKTSGDNYLQASGNNQAWSSTSFSAFVGAPAGSVATIDQIKFDASAYLAGTTSASTSTANLGYVITYRKGTMAGDGSFSFTGGYTFFTDYRQAKNGSGTPTGVTGVTDAGVITTPSTNNLIYNGHQLNMGTTTVGNFKTFDSNVRNFGNPTIAGLGTNVTNFTGKRPVFLSGNEAVEFKINFFRISGTANANLRVRLDNVAFYGTAVPEPTSMAIFGAMGLGLVARRLRSRK